MKRIIGLTIMVLVLCFFVSCVSKAEDSEDDSARASEVFTREGEEGKLTVRFLDMIAYESTGYRKKTGDCSILVSPDGKIMMIDCGTPTAGTQITKKLDEMGIDHIDYLVLSHMHADHIGGAPSVIAHVDVGQILMTGDRSDEYGGTYYSSLMDAIYTENVPYQIVYDGYEFYFGNDVKVSCYGPYEGYDFTKDSSDVVVRNNSSLVLRFVYGSSSFLFAGDLYSGGEESVMTRHPEGLQSDVIKMNHHGYEASNTLAWAKYVKPKLAFGTMTHGVDPAKEMVYRSVGALVFFAYADGSVRVSTTGDGSYEAVTEIDRNIVALSSKYINEDGHYKF